MVEGVLQEIELSGLRGKESLKQEVILGQKVRQASFDVDSPDLVFHLLEFNQKNRKAFVGQSLGMPPLVSVIKAAGHNAVLGRERFFEAPYWWNFECEKPGILIETLELMKGAGLVNAFLKQGEVAVADFMATRAEEIWLDSSDERDEGFSRMSWQPLFLEVAFVFICGTFLGLLGAAMLEPILASWMKKDFVAAIRSHKSA